MTKFVTGSDGHKTSFITLGTHQTALVAISSTAISNAFGSSTQLVRIVANEACHIKFGTTPVAAGTDPLLPANRIEHFGVEPGEKLACIQVAGGAGAGFISVTEAA